MRLSQAWIVARHDLGLLRKRRGVMTGLVAMPIGVAVGFPLLTRFILQQSPDIPTAALESLLGAFSFWFAIAGAILPASIASYSIVGEKTEKSLEPLLATPTTDGEVLLGKVLSALVPTLAAIWGGALLYMALMDRILAPHLGGWYFPNGAFTVVLLALCPVVSFTSIETSIAVSGWVTDVRSAQQLSSAVVLPFMLLYVFGEVGIVPLDTPHLLEIAGVMALLGVGLFVVTRQTFHRETILTRWK